jgi:hypothetical protein
VTAKVTANYDYLLSAAHQKLKDECAKWMVELQVDAIKAQQLQAPARRRLKQAVCYIFWDGIPKLANLLKAGPLAIEYSLDVSKTIANQTGFALWILLKTCLEPYCFLTFTYLVPEHLNNKNATSQLLGEGYSNILTFHSIVLDSDMYAHYARCVARSGACWWFDQQYQLTVLPRFAAVRDFERFERDFETAHTSINPMMKTYYMQCLSLWSSLTPHALVRTLRLWGVSWSNAVERTKAQKPPGLTAYEEERDGEWCGMWHQGYVVMVAQAVLAARIPNSVPPAEIAEFLPQTGASLFF